MIFVFQFLSLKGITLCLGVMGGEKEKKILS